MSALVTASPVAHVGELSQVEAQKVFEAASKRWYKVSGRAFARAYDCAVIERDTAKAQFVESLRRLARQ